jgi:hypothetical protein
VGVASSSLRARQAGQQHALSANRSRAQLTAQHYTVAFSETRVCCASKSRNYEVMRRMHVAFQAYKSQHSRLSFFLLASRPRLRLHCYQPYLRRPFALLIGSRPSPRPFPIMTPSAHLSAGFDCSNTYGYPDNPRFGWPKQLQLIHST